jgi:hypothetical protein
MKVNGWGVTFLYFAANGQVDDTFQVDQSWSGVHALVSKLRRQQEYSANDHSFSAWKQGDELNIRFHTFDMPLEEILIFSSEMTAKILSALETLPNLN